MDINHLLTRGSETGSGMGLHQRKQQIRAEQKESEPEIAACALAEGISAAAEKFSISETAVAKCCARMIKKESSVTAEQFIDPSRVSELKAIILNGNTSSVKRIVEAARGRFSEAEIRIVKAELEKRSGESWEF